MLSTSKLIEHAKKDEGVRESPRGSNRGTRVEAMLKNTGLGGGFPWCAAAVATWGKESFGKDWPLPLSASCDVLLEFARNTTIKGLGHSMLYDSPKEGDVFLVMASKHDAVHTGIVTWVDGNRFGTIEGNTNGGGSREGDGVYQRKRTIGERTYKFIRWVNLASGINNQVVKIDWTVNAAYGKYTVAANDEGRLVVGVRKMFDIVFGDSHQLGREDSFLTWKGGPLALKHWVSDQGIAMCLLADWAKAVGRGISVKDDAKEVLIV